MAPQIDQCQDEVVRALIRDGWQIIFPSAYYGDDGFLIYVDLLATKGQEVRHIEVKCFPGVSRSSELYTAVGQFVVYRTFFDKWKIPGQLYLAVPSDVFPDEFKETALQVFREYHVNMLVVDIESEVITQWIEW